MYGKTVAVCPVTFTSGATPYFSKHIFLNTHSKSLSLILVYIASININNIRSNAPGLDIHIAASNNT